MIRFDVGRWFDENQMGRQWRCLECVPESAVRLVGIVIVVKRCNRAKLDGADTGESIAAASKAKPKNEKGTSAARWGESKRSENDEAPEVQVVRIE